MKTVLIMDDSAFSRGILRKVIESGGYRTIEAANGTQAVALFESERPDLVTLDLLMPDMDGIDVAKKILEIDPAAKTVIVSTDKQKFRKKEAKAAGVLAFIPKPIDDEDFLEEINRLLDEN